MKVARTAKPGGIVAEGSANGGRRQIEDEKQTKRDIAITPSLWSEIQERARELEMSASAWIRDAVRQKLRADKPRDAKSDKDAAA